MDESDRGGRSATRSIRAEPPLSTTPVTLPRSLGVSVALGKRARGRCYGGCGGASGLTLAHCGDAATAVVAQHVVAGRRDARRARTARRTEACGTARLAR